MVPSFSFPKLSRAVVRVRRLAAHLSKATMSTNLQSNSSSSAANGDAPTAAILIIGDEILKVLLVLIKLVPCVAFKLYVYDSTQ